MVGDREETKCQQKLRDANRWKEMEIIRPGKREGCVDTKAPNGCESSGAKHNRARMFLTRYQCPSPC